jgi:glycosyltransferase involved in cell wall biosynthesis
MSSGPPTIALLTFASMGPILTALAWALDALSIGLFVYWSIAAWRLIQTRRRVPTARAGIALAAANPPNASVCVIVPAHNEEATIGHLVASLRSQDFPHLSVVLSLDRCTDRTAAAARSAIAGDPRFHVHEVTSCPEGWAGKVNAVWQGVQTPKARAADLLLFADADTTFDPACVRACAALLAHRDIDLLSLLSTLTCDTWFERIVQPAAGFELVRQYPISRANRRRNPRAFANGQFMLFRRDAYDAIGGHESVHDELLEDIALAREIAESGRAPGVFLADGLLRCRMYDSWPAFRAGWKRIYIESAKRKIGRLRRAGLAATVTGCILPLGAVAALIYSLILLTLDDPTSDMHRAGVAGLAISAAAIAVWFAVMSAALRMSRTPIWTIPAYPIGAWLVGRILAEAASDVRHRVPVRWAGREYIREPR